MADYTKGEFKKESRILLQALDAKLPKLIDKEQDIEICFKKSVRIIVEDYGMGEGIAVDLVDTLIHVLKGVPFPKHETASQENESKNKPNKEAKKESAVPKEQYFISLNGTNSGPFELETMKEKIKKGELKRETSVWKEGMKEWAAASAVKELSSFLPPSALPPAPEVKTPQPKPVPSSGSTAVPVKAANDGTIIRSSSSTDRNYSRGGDAVIKDGYIYYRSKVDFNKLYKMRIDGTGRQRINDENSSDIIVEAEWVYYRGTGDKLCRIRTDGTGRQILNNKKCHNICVADEWVYYGLFKNVLSQKLYRIRTDGKGQQKLTDIYAFDFSVSGGYVYFRGGDDVNRDLYRIRTDGTGLQKIFDSLPGISDLIVSGDWVYYTERDNLYRIRTDGTGQQKINDDKIVSINAAGEWVYFINGNDKKLHMIRTDGTGKQKLNDDDFDEIVNISSGWIFLTYVYYGWKLCRIRTDGTDRQKVE